MKQVNQRVRKLFALLLVLALLPACLPNRPASAATVSPEDDPYHVHQYDSDSVEYESMPDCTHGGVLIHFCTTPGCSGYYVEKLAPL